MPARCAAITRAGSPCPSPPLPASAYCFVHDPAAAEARREASRKGGKARSNQARAHKQIPEALTADELIGYLSGLFRAVIGGRVEPKVGTAAATIARVLVDVQERVEIEARLTELEKAAGAPRKGWTA